VAKVNDILIPSLTFEEILSDGSTLTNPAADHRRLFLGEDGLFHLRDSSGAITDVGSGGSGVTVQDEGTPLSTLGTTLNFAGAGVTATGTGATKTITIPGGSGEADVIAEVFGTPDTAFEFGTTSLTGLTAMGTPDIEEAHTTMPGHYYVSDNDSSQVGRYAAVTPPFTAITKMTEAVVRVNYHYAGMFCGEATPGKMVSALMVFVDTDQGPTLRSFSTPADGSPGSPTLLTPPARSLGHYPIYFAIRANSSTDVDYFFSHTGRIWYPLALAHNFSMTVASVGLNATSYSATAVQAAYDYLRIWNSAKTFARFA
jgi:hypothetical protein